MTLLLGATWPYMTPDYVYNEMTWSEIGAALEYVFCFVAEDRHYRGSKKFNTWMYSSVDTLAKDLKRISSELRRR